MEVDENIDNGDLADWTGRNAKPQKHGGRKAAVFICVVEVLENMVFLCNASNFVAYFQKSMHYPIAVSANMVTNFMGTSFLLTIFGGFVSDSFFTRFTTFIVFCSTELLGLLLLTIQAHKTSLQPDEGRRPSGFEAFVLFTGLYAMAIGVGGVKASLPAHGGDQFDNSNQRLISSFFNWYFFSLCTGGLLSSTVMVWVEENKGWNWSFNISVVVLSLALGIFISGFPFYRFKRSRGSPLTRVFRVFASAAHNRKATQIEIENQNANTRTQQKFKFLDKALNDATIIESQVEETKTFLGLFPIFASTIMMNCCLAQLQTFSVQQGSIMNRTIHNFKIPTQSLTVLPITIMLASIPLYESSVHIFGKKLAAKGNNIFQPLRRIGLGLALASGSMAAAAFVEVKRKNASQNNVTLSVFWLTWQYLLLGVSDMLTLGGMLEFFYSEAPPSMQSMSTALSWCSASMGFFISSLLVSIANSLSGRFGKEWLGGDNLNHNHLELFYGLLCILNFINFLNYIYWAKRY